MYDSLIHFVGQQTGFANEGISQNFQIAAVFLAHYHAPSTFSPCVQFRTLCHAVSGTMRPLTSKKGLGQMLLDELTVFAADFPSDKRLFPFSCSTPVRNSSCLPQNQRCPSI